MTNHRFEHTPCTSHTVLGATSYRSPRNPICSPVVYFPANISGSASHILRTLRPRRGDRDWHWGFTRRIVAWKDMISKELQRELGQRPSGSRLGIKIHRGVWIRYCIVPLLSSPPATDPPCETDEVAGVARLSLAQSQLVFADMLASMDT